MKKNIIVEQYIPANPGFYMIFEVENRKLIVDDPVLMWGISEKHGIIPFTIEGNAYYFDDFWGILNPDGSVTAPHVGRYPSIEAAEERPI
jgi:hypothetical protein